MDIILLDDIEKVGEKHEVVSVKPGFARNYLIPQGKAIVANKSNQKKLNELIRRDTGRLAARKAEFEEIAEKLRSTVLKVGAKVGTSGKIFGSVTNVQLSQAIKDQIGLDIDRRNITLTEEVKSLGTYTARVDLHREVEGKVNFEVVKE